MSKKERHQVAKDISRDLLPFYPGDDARTFGLMFLRWAKLTDFPDDVLMMKLMAQLRDGALGWAQSQAFENWMDLAPRKALKKLKRAFPPPDNSEREQELRVLKYDMHKEPHDFWNDFMDKLNKLKRRTSETEKVIFAMNCIEGDKEIHMLLDLKGPRTLDGVRKGFFKQVHNRDKIRKAQNLEPVRKPKPARQVQNRNRRDNRTNSVILEDETEYEISTTAMAPATSTPLLQALGVVLPAALSTGGNQQQQLRPLKPFYENRYQGGGNAGPNRSNTTQPVQSHQMKSPQQGTGSALMPRTRPTCEHCANSLPWQHWQSNCLQKIFQIRAGIENPRVAFAKVMQILTMNGYKGNERPVQELWDKVLNLAPKERREPAYYGEKTKN